MADPILIVGAGPTGLVLAIELARRGVPFHLIDQRPEPLQWDRAAVVKSRTLEIMASLGLADAFVRRGKIFRGVDFYDRSARRTSFRLKDIDSPFPFTLGLAESETERLLTEKLTELGGNVERGVTLVGLEQHGDEVRAHVRNDGDERVIAAGWIVGTDGLHSRVRDAAGIAYPGHDYALPWGVVDVRLGSWPHADDVAAIMFDPPVLPVPMGPDTWRIYFRPDPASTSHTNEVARRLALLAPGTTVLKHDEPQLFHTHYRVATRFRSGRILIAGDAAHACSPIEGHGMNVGIQDSFNLGWKIALVTTGEAPDSLLDSYDAERRPIAGMVGKSGDDAEANAARGDPTAIETAVKALATDDDRFKAAIRESEIGHGYAESPILGASGSQPTASPATAIGYRVGDAGPVAGQAGATRLHGLLAHTGHTLFLTIGEVDAAATRGALDLVRGISRRYSPHVTSYVVKASANPDVPEAPELLADRTGTVRARLGGAGLCLIRPDGYLGLRCSPPALSAVEAYLARILR